MIFTMISSKLLLLLTIISNIYKLLQFENKNIPCDRKIVLLVDII